MSLLEFVLLVVIGAALLPYLLGPLLVRFTQRQPVRWEWVAFDAGRHALPAELDPLFQRNVATLAGQGFGLVADLVTLSTPKVVLRTALMRSTDGDASAIVAAARSTEPRVSAAQCYVGFGTEFADGRVLSVTNSTEPSVYAPVASKIEERLPEVRDPGRLYRIHRALVSRYAKAAAAVPRDPGENPPGFLSDAVERENRRQLETGYLLLDDVSGAFRPTWRGAWLMTWKLLPPWRQLRERAVLRRGRALVRELGMEGPDRQPIPAPKTVDAMRWNFVVLVVALLLYAAVRARPGAGGGAVVLPAGFEVPASFPQAVQAFEGLAGAPRQPLWGTGPGGDSVATDGFAFMVPEARAGGLLAAVHGLFLERGFYVFRHERHFGLGGRPDELGLLPTPDPYAVVRLMGTNGWNYDIGPDSIVAWLRTLERDERFVLTGIGFDFLEGRFTGKIRDAEALARRFYGFCPDIVTQGTGSLRALAQELRRSKELYCWWD